MHNTGRAVFFVSDGTGITAETLGKGLLSQFEGIHWHSLTWPFVDSLEKAEDVAQRIDLLWQQEGERPLIFSTLINPAIRARIAASQGVLFDLFDSFTPRLEAELGCSVHPVVGRFHSMGDSSRYNARIGALNFALANDDGATTRGYPAAEIILIGVSRSGKTPTSLHLAMQYGVLAANYPITEEDLSSRQLPQLLEPYRERLFGLTIEAERLAQIRAERYPGSRYASPEQCRQELERANALFRREKIPYLNTTHASVEEIAARLLQQAQLARRTDY